MCKSAIKDLLNQIDQMLMNCEDMSNERLRELLTLKSILKNDLIVLLENEIKQLEQVA